MPEDAITGTVVAGCRIVETIGRGGMGVVYLAEQEALGRRVALKLLSRELAGDPGFRERFQEEARTAASLDHPNVISIHDAGEHDGELYIVMRWVPGGDLRRLLRDGPVSPERAAALTAQVASALDAAHARGLVHRDVKAANVLLADDGATAYLTDFGLTKAAAQTSGLTRTGQWLGTLDACAPEQIEGRRVDARTDVYALGCLLFQLLTGSVPYRRDHDAAKVWAHVNAPVPSPRELVPTLDPRWDALFASALAKDPAERFASAGGLGRAAVALAAGRDPEPADRSVATGPAAPGPDDVTAVVGPSDDAPTAVASTAATGPERTLIAGGDGAGGGGAGAGGGGAGRGGAGDSGGAGDAGGAGGPQRGERKVVIAALAAVAVVLVGGGATALALRGGGGDAPPVETVVRTVDRAAETTDRTTPVADDVAEDGDDTAATTASAARAPKKPKPRARAVASPPTEPAGVPTAWAPFNGVDYAVDVPAGWANVAVDRTENADPPRYRSQWSDAGCGCGLIVDWMPGYGRSGMANAQESAGGEIVPTTIAGFGDVALRTASSDDLHTATYFIAYAGGNYAIRGEARSPETALDLATRAASSLTPHGH